MTLIPPPVFREDAGDGWFIPVHPAPRTQPRSPLQVILAARRDLLGNWHQEDYALGVKSFRLLGRQMVIVNTPEGVKHTLVTAHDNYERKSPQMRRALEYLLGDGLFISDGATWRARRPLVADIVHKNRMPAFGPAMADAAGETVRRWRERPQGQPLDVLTEMGALTADIIGRTVFGVRLERGQALEVIRGFAAYQERIESFNVGYLLGFDEGTPVWKGLRLRQAVRRVHKVVDKVIDDHLAGRAEHASMLDLLALRQARSPDAPIGRDALRDEAATIFMAGHETTAAVLAWAWYMLAKAPWAEAAVHTEVAAVCGGRAPSLEDVPSLDYCRAVIEETLRLYPPVAILGRQARAADRIGAVEVEPGGLILVSPWLLHRSSQLWDRPHHFVPERFLGPTRPQPYSYIPFAVGPRICPGLNFGLSEAVLCLATLAQAFTLRLPPGLSLEPQCRLTLRPHGGLPMQVHPR